MANSDIIRKRSIFMRLLSVGRLYDAIVMIRDLSESALTWELTDDINGIESSYSYMLRYAVDGVEDPRQREIYESLVDRLSTAYDRLDWMTRVKDDPAIYYSIARNRRNVKVAQAVDNYMKVLERVKSEESGDTNARLCLEARETELFETIWVAFPLGSDAVESLKRLMEHGNGVPNHVKRLVISALMLGSFQYFDTRRISLLADIYVDRYSTRSGIIALIALILALYANRRTRIPVALRHRLEALRDVPSWKSDLRIAFLELIRTRDTERITKKLTDEIVPEMLKMKPEIDRTMASKKIEDLDISELEENPMWQDLLDKSGIADKMKELSEIQEEGGDVLMGTFAHLKSFPFFFSVSNWFLPFHRGHSIVANMGEWGERVAQMIAKSAFMCDSDKYSFMLALGSVAGPQRDMMASQLEAQNLNAEELQAASLDTTVDRRANEANKYVQNLYRFFRLFRRKDDFADPFASAINLTEIPLLAREFEGDNTLQLVAEFYFKHQYYHEALDLFRLIENFGMINDSLYQKIGYCYEKLGEREKAVESYTTAEYFDSSDPWLMRRLGACYRKLGNYEKALYYYRQLAAKSPDDTVLTNAIGDCLMNLGRYDEAVKAFQKIDYLKPSAKTTRRLVKAYMMQRDFDKASQLSERLLAMPDVSPEDLLIAGHIATAQRNYRTAIDRYAESIECAGGNFTLFLNAMRADTKKLTALGVPSETIPLLIDAVAYKRRGVL